MFNLMKPISGTRMLELKKEIADSKRQIKKCNDDREVRRLKRQLSEKQTYYNILADKQKIHS